MKRERVNPDIELQCDNCMTKFIRNKHEIARRKHKKKEDGSERTHFFCSRSCSTSWRNKDEARRGIESKGSFKFRPEFAGNHARKYDVRFSWYIYRMKKDHRFEENPDGMELNEELACVWTGKCAYTNIPLTLRDINGKCDQPNPFFVASVDRIDNSKPYGPGNIQWVSCAINMARNKHTSDDFINYLAEFVSEINS